MTTVADLVAKLGFQVDTKGFDKFKSSLESFQRVVSSGLRDLKEYAKQAEKISKAFKETYLPSRQDAEKRFKAETYAIRARAYAQRTRAKLLPETLAIRRYNAEIRDRQTALKEAGLTTGGNQNTLLGNLLGGHSFLGSILGLFGGIIHPLGAIIGQYIGNALTKIMSGLYKLGSFLVGQMREGLKFAMAYRDYRNFSGRSTTSLGRLAAGTFNTANMRPEDVLRDALSMETNFWEMMLGGGNPAAYQLLGIRPTGNGEVDLQNIVSEIGRQTGGFKNRGLARTLFKMFGLSEDYLNIALAKSGTKGTSVESELNRLLKSAPEIERVNMALKEFEFQLNKARVELLQAFVESGAFDTIKSAIFDLMKNLPKIIDVFKDLFIIVRNMVDWIKEHFPEWFPTGDNVNKELLNKEFGLGSFEMDRFLQDAIRGVNTGDYYNKQNVSMNPVFNVNSTSQAMDLYRGVNQDAVAMYGLQVNTATILAPSVTGG